MAPRNSAIVGVGAIAIGTVGMYGSLTGRLPAMLAAIFYPQLLSDQSGQNQGPLSAPPTDPLSRLWQGIVHAANPLHVIP